MVHPFTPDRHGDPIGVCDDPDCAPCRRFASTVFDRPAVVLDLLDRIAVDPAEVRTDVVCLDEHRRGVGVFTVTGTVDRESVISIGGVIAGAFSGPGRVESVVVASHRPDGGADLDDVERWLELDAIVTEAGIELVEWFVVGIGGVACPRELVGDADRWAA